MAPEPVLPDLPPSTLGDLVLAEVFREITLQEDLRMPESDAALSDVTVDADRVVFRYEGSPSVRLEASQVIIGVRDGGYMRRITRVTTAPDGAVVATTEHATLLDVIADGHFRVTVSSEEVMSMRDLMDGGVGAASEPLSASGAFPIIPESESNPCAAMVSGEIWFEPALTYNRELTFEVDISWFQVKSYTFIVDNALRASFSTGAYAALDAACNVDLISIINQRREMAGRGRFRVERLTNVQVGPIPVLFTHTFTPIFELGLSLSLNAETRFDAFAQAGGRVGFTWDRDDELRYVFEPNNDAGAELTTEAVAEIEAGVTAAGLSYQLKLYDAIGPTLTLTGSLLGHAEADLLACEWTTWAELGGNFNLRGSLELPIVDIALLSVEYDFPFSSVEFARSSGPIGSGCGMTDGGMTDGGMTDGGMTDGGMTDGGMTDGGMADGGMTDGGMTDGGMTDGGMTDGGMTDGGMTDGGMTDGGMTDGGMTDGGMADGGMTDGGGAADGGGCGAGGVPTLVTSRGAVTATSTAPGGYPTYLAVDGNVMTSWFSGGVADTTPEFTWTVPVPTCIHTIAFDNNAMHFNPSFRTDYGFNTVRIEIRATPGGAVVWTEDRSLAGRPDPNISVMPLRRSDAGPRSVMGREVALIFGMHDDPGCGGFSELRVTALE